MSTNLDIYSWLVDSRMMPVNLTEDNQATDPLPTPSPDGTWLAYVAMARPGFEADRLALMLRHINTGARKKLTEAGDRPDGPNEQKSAQSERGGGDRIGPGGGR